MARIYQDTSKYKGVPIEMPCSYCHKLFQQPSDVGHPFHYCLDHRALKYRRRVQARARKANLIGNHQ